METKFKRRRNIERATAFKVQYLQLLGDDEEIKEREFNTLKSMSQWCARNDDAFDTVIFKTLALIDNEWESFTTTGKKTVTLSDMETIIRNLRKDYKPSKK